MKNILFLFSLLLTATTIVAQTLYTRNDSIAIIGDSVTLHPGQYRGAIQWQHSLSGQIWNNIEGKTNELLKVSKSDEGYYRAQVTDDSCFPSYSDTAVVVDYKSGNPMVIDPDEVPGATLVDRDSSIFTFISRSSTTIPINTVFLENDKESDIRVVSGVTQIGDFLTVNTLPGKMEDLFVNQTFSLTTGLMTSVAKATYLSNTGLSKALTDNEGFIYPSEVINLKDSNTLLKSVSSIEDIPVVNISENLSGEKLYNKNGMELTIVDGYFNMGALLRSEFDFKQTRFQWTDLPKGKLKSCIFYADGEKTAIETKLILEAKTYGPVSVDETFLLRQDVFKSLFKFWVGEIPVWMYVKIDLMAKVKGDFSNTFSVTGGTLSELDINLGTTYSNGEWSPFFIYSKAFSLYDPIYDGHINYFALCEVYPHIETFFYYSSCPYMEIVPYISQEMDNSILGNYNSGLCAGLDVRTGVAGNILGYGIPEYEKEYNIAPDTLFIEPSKLEIIGGNEQEGTPGEELIQPIVLRVINLKENTVANVPVHFSTVSGSVDSIAPKTDSEGKVTVKWTMGNSPGGQILEAFLKDGNDTKIDNTIITITAQSTVKLPTVETGTISEIFESSAICGGNVTGNGGGEITSRGVCWSTSENPTIANSKTIDGSGIGFFSSNLLWLRAGTIYYVRAYATNSQGTGYGNQISFRTGMDGCTTGAFTDNRDGKIYQTVDIGSQTWMAENLAYLPYTTPVETWSESSSCYYVYDYSAFGVLYNFPAAVNACPPGWHLPSDAEWDIMADYLGGREVAGGKMKSLTGWRSPNTGASNESCFTGLPGGGFNRGFFYSYGERGYWWTSTEIDSQLIWVRSLFYNIPELYRSYFYRPVGYSVRCVKD